MTNILCFEYPALGNLNSYCFSGDSPYCVVFYSGIQPGRIRAKKCLMGVCALRVSNGVYPTIPSPRLKLSHTVADLAGIA
jgi:hypothetical protein